MVKKKTRDSAAIAQKSRITKAAKVLTKWADDEVRLELVMPRFGLRVKGTIRSLGDDGFLFVSDSREITSRIFLSLFDSIAVQRGGPLGIAVHLRSEVNGDWGITLAEEYVSESQAVDISAVLKQLKQWAKTRTKLTSAFQFSFTFSTWSGTIEERTPGVFALPNESQTHFVDTSQCGRVTVKRVEGVTTVTLASRTGDFAAVISDSLSQFEATYRMLATASTIVH